MFIHTFVKRFILILPLMATVVACTSTTEPDIQATQPAIGLTDTPVAGTAVPTASPLPATLIPATSTPISDRGVTWSDYHNEFYAYQVSYPPEAQIEARGAEYVSSEQVPANMTEAEYLAQLKSTYPDSICLTIVYQQGFVTILAPRDNGGQFIGICGLGGIGVYEFTEKAEEIVIDGHSNTATGAELREQNADRTFRGGYFIVTLVDGTTITYGTADLLATASGQSEDLAYEDYLLLMETLRRIVSSYRATGTAVRPTLPATDQAISSMLPGLSETTSIDTLNPAALIKVPFVRDGSIYLYEDGIEKLVAKPAQQTTPSACLNIFYPFLSPNGKYLAYIEQAGESPDLDWGCSAGFLRVVDISTGVNKPTDYRITYFRWTPDNLLNFLLERELIEIPPQFIDREIYFDPATQTESLFETIINRDPNTGAETLLSADYPSDNLSKLVRLRDDNYYLVDNTLNEETFLFDAAQIITFLEWSPGSRYAIFASTKIPTGIFEIIEFVVDTQNPGVAMTEITVGGGAAGGDPPAGRKWYFEKGFVAYCREELYFVDGSPPWQLTNDGGGGCNNEEGFVATSPNGEYAFIKFQDRFELHDIEGNVTVVQEVEPLVKGRGIPKNFIWLNDDYMIIFESTYEGGYYAPAESPQVYLFDRQANTISPLIENAYLIEIGP